MTDTEINEKVARGFGWVQCCNPRTMENGKIVDCFGWSKGGSHFHEVYPDYCHSIEAAWKIVEKHRLSIEHVRMIPSNAEAFWEWFVTIQIGPNHLEGSFITARADSAPRAICLAFLKVP